MSATHLHLLLNHLPIVGIPLALGLLAWASLAAQEQVKRAALALFVLAGVGLWPVYLTGEPAEETVEKLPAVSESLIEAHEDAAKVALVAAELLAAGALGGLILFRQRALPTGVTLALLGLALLASLALAWTGYLGGQIRHSEIRSDALAIPTRPVEDDR